MGIIEAKKAGQTLIGVEEQSSKYLTNLPDILSTARSTLPFSYETTGIETRFTNHLDPEPRSRQVFAFHQPMLKVYQSFKDQGLTSARAIADATGIGRTKVNDLLNRLQVLGFIERS